MIVWHPEWLYRSPCELEEFVEAVGRAGAQVATVVAGELDLSIASGG